MGLVSILGALLGEILQLMPQVIYSEFFLV